MAAWLKTHCAAVALPARQGPALSLPSMQAHLQQRRAHLAVVWSITEVCTCKCTFTGRVPVCVVCFAVWRVQWMLRILSPVRCARLGKLCGLHG
jgi:hypothetical protein